MTSDVMTTAEAIVYLADTIKYIGSGAGTLAIFFLLFKNMGGQT